MLLYITICILILSLVLLGWISSLKWQVKKRTAALAESESRFRESVDFMPIPVGIADDEGRILLLNKEFTARFGYEQAQVPTMQEWVRRAYPDPVYLNKSQAQWIRDVEEARIARTSTTPRTYRIQALDGTQHEVEITMRPMGNLFITTFNDVTERNSTEAELKRSETQYRRLHESIQDAYVRISLDGKIIETNRAYRELLGYSADELSRLHYHDFTPEKWHAHEKELVQHQIFTRGYSEVYEKEYIRKDGSVIPVELRSFMIIGEEGKPEQMWAIVRDLSERKRLETQLLQAQKMEAIGQLAGGVAHDFNNILAALMLNVGMLAKDMPGEDERTQTMGEIQDDLNRAAELTRQLLAFSRRQAMQMTTIRVEPLIGKSVRMLQRILGEHITIDDSRIGELPELVANAGMIEQMLTNLCLNARDAMPRGGTLTISAATETFDEFALRQHAGCRPGTYVRISIQDTGTGMDEEMRKRIFEPFFTTKEIGHGTGLGLSIVFGIVQQHSGWIDVESTPGKGSTFTVHLPTNAGIGKPLPGRKPFPAARQGHEKILLVEDEANVRKALGAGLERLGYAVQAASSASEAFVLWQCSSGDFDLLITDIIMPGGVNGMELAVMLKRQKQSLRVIVSSGYHKELEGATLEEAGSFTRMPKPYTIEMLSATIRQALEEPA
jgi:PAS domain S-box-containing protein